MDALHVVLLCLALAGFVLAVVLFLRLSRSVASLAVANTLAERAEKDALAGQSELRVVRDQLNQQIETFRAQANAAENRAIELEGELKETIARHAGELAKTRELAAAERDGMLRREADLRASHDAAFAALRNEFANLTTKATQETQERLTKWATQSLAIQTQTAAGDLETKKQAVEALIKPIADTLKQTDTKLAQIDKDRAQSQASIEEQLRSMREASGKLGDEARRLSEALRKPDVRGRYGEMQLRRVAELAGMVEYCDFATQVSNDLNASDPNSARVRPDMVVKLPSGRRVIVDAKTNIQAYLDAMQAATPEDAGRHLDRFAQHVAQQATDLSKKEYWKQFEGSPEFVVMFVPGDQFVDAALSRQPDILEQAAARNVILASPATLIGLLRAVAIGYREERLAKEAHALRDLGREFLDRIANVVEPLAALAKNLESATSNYNRFVSSYESRLLPTLNKFEESGVTSKKKIEALASVSTHFKPLPGAGSSTPQPALPAAELFKE